MDPERYPNEIDQWLAGAAIGSFAICMLVLIFWSSAFIAVLLIAFCSYSMFYGVRTAKIDGWRKRKADTADDAEGR